MNTVLLGLKNLQEVDDQIHLNQATVEEAAAKRTELAAAEAAAKKNLAEAKIFLQEMRSRHRDLEAEVADLSVKKKNNENRQMSVKSQNEYEALLKEAEFFAARINELEDEILELLDRLEERESAIIGLANEFSEQEAACRLISADADAKEASSRHKLAELELRRGELKAELPPLQVRQYEEIAKVRAGLAVSAAADGLCLACRLGFPPQLFNELQRNEKIVRCPNCTRIIYWRDHPDFKEEENTPPCPDAK